MKSLNGEIIWALPVNQDKGDDKQIAHNAKYHCFDDSKSLCEKYVQDNDFFETNIESGEILSNPQFACKVCYRKWRKIFNL